MTQTTDHRIKQASLREEWSVSSVQRLAWAMGRPAARPVAAPRAAAGQPTTSARQEQIPQTVVGAPDPARQLRLIQSLGRLAGDPHASTAERKLAAERMIRLQASAYPTAC